MLGHCPDEVPARGTHEHSYFAYVNCESIDEIYRDYRKRGAEIFQAISDKPWGLREFGVATPEGHRIIFGEDVELSENSSPGGQPDAKSVPLLVPSAGAPAPVAFTLFCGWISSH
ncbi:VOC family protein [Halovibrio variabilis]|uniref:VOC family protein n=1 Tax=Halovibrio variabilis TaxID=31910 RepID=UPI00353071BB